ncbi:hypothetical protein GCM10009122_27200 [Fulvivirga kasyanovii]|uniref:hypothetical protein n=2 Tax=Fulvivirga kasyanovii TaxID=396812 RepID=UPI0031DCCE5B
MIRKILIILALFLISCKKDSSEKQQNSTSTTEQDSLKALNATRIDEEENTQEHKQEHDSLEHIQLFNLISKHTNPKRQFINTDSLSAFEIQEVGYFDATDYAYFFIAPLTDSLKEYHKHLSKSIGPVMAEGSWFKRHSLSEDFIHTYYSHIAHDSLDLFNYSNEYFGRGYFDKMEYMMINYEDGMSVDGVVALYRFTQPIPANRYYGLTGQYSLNEGIKAEEMDQEGAFISHILNNLNLSDEPSNIFQWYLGGYDKLYTHVYYDQENGQVDSYLIETGSIESKIALNLHGDEIREFIATGIFINDKPVLFLLLSDPYSDGGDFCMAIFNGSEYQLSC